jgi:sirohydrochlorin ferrochelatase
MTDGSAGQLPIDNDRTGIIVVDHGSRLDASNQMLILAAEAFADYTSHKIVEPAHMELAPPDIAAAFRKCVQQGADRVIVFPWFLSPGRHWSQDIPRLVAQAAVEFPGIPWLVTAPFGLHHGMLEVMSDRIRRCLQHAEQSDTQDVGHLRCDVCGDQPGCRFGGSRTSGSR